MSVPQEHKGRYVYHMTHLENLESILQNGLLSTNEKDRLGIDHKNIANQSIQTRRSVMNVACGPEGTVHDYVPFYFAPRSPMLYAIHCRAVEGCDKQQDEILHFVFKIDDVIQSDLKFVFTNGHSGQGTSHL